MANLRQNDEYLTLIKEGNILDDFPIVEFHQGKWNSFSKGFIFTNEGLDALMDNINHRDKTILGITGSADHMISSISHGCTGYIGTDISLYACLFAELKLASVKALDYNEFLNFYVPSIDLPSMLYGGKNILTVRHETQYPFSKDLYDKVEKSLSNTAKIFFESKIRNGFLCDSHVLPVLFKYLMNFLPASSLKCAVPYIKSKKLYDQAKERLQEIEIPITRLGNIDKVCKDLGRFDILYLSNIPQYSKGIELIESVSSHIKENGIIIAFNISELESILPKRGFRIIKKISSIRPKNLPPSTRFMTDAYILTK